MAFVGRREAPGRPPRPPWRPHSMPQGPCVPGRPALRPPPGCSLPGAPRWLISATRVAKASFRAKWGLSRSPSRTKLTSILLPLFFREFTTAPRGTSTVAGRPSQRTGAPSVPMSPGCDLSPPRHMHTPVPLHALHHGGHVEGALAHHRRGHHFSDGGLDLLQPDLQRRLAHGRVEQIHDAILERDTGDGDRPDRLVPGWATQQAGDPKSVRASDAVSRWCAGTRIRASRDDHPRTVSEANQLGDRSRPHRLHDELGQ